MLFSDRRRIIKHEARRLLYRSYKPMLLFSILSSFAVIGAKRVTEIFNDICRMGLTEFSSYSFTLIITAICFVILCPLFAGAVSFSSLAAEGNNSHFSVFFGCFDSPHLFIRSVRYGTALLFCFLLMCAVPVLCGNALSAVSELFSKTDFAYLLAETAAYIIILTAFIVSAAAFCIMIFTCNSGKNEKSGGVFLTYIASLKLLKGHTFEFLVFNISFFPLFLASYLTCGLLWRLFGFPYYILSLHVFISYVKSEKNPPKFFSFSE